MKSFPNDLLGSSRVLLLVVAALAWFCKAVPLLMKGSSGAIVETADYLREYAPRLLAGSATVAGLLHARSVERWQALFVPLALLLALTGLHLHAANYPQEVGQVEDLGVTALTLAFPFAVLYPLARRGPRGIGSLTVCLVSFGVGLALGTIRPTRTTSFLSAGLGLPTNSTYAPLTGAFIAALVPLVFSRKYGFTVSIATFAAALLPPLWGDGVRLAICIVGMSRSSA